MKIMIQRIKTNLFLTFVILAYVLLLIIQPALSIQGIQNSKYYIQEMLLIMPVVFVLTALLDTWIPKETILKMLGTDSSWKGALLAFLLGSVSAGPVYAAFPFCKTLHKKGASISNIIIILSSWAVIKVPMLMNETKFLGLTFMVTRWFLTVIAIFIMAWLIAKLVKDEDLLSVDTDQNPSVTISTKSCIGCGICAKHYPSCFTIENHKAKLTNLETLDPTLLQETIAACPLNAIQYL